LGPRPRPLFRLCVLAALSVGLLFAPGAGQASAAGRPVAWGCGPFDYGQCSVPGGLNGVTAIAAGERASLALKGDGTVVSWGCGYYLCVPSGLSGVTAIAAGNSHNLALNRDGTAPPPPTASP
jgi:hypothetical protein